MKGFLTALQFLTVIRISRSRKITENDLGRSMAYYPLVGFLLGLILAGGRVLLDGVLPSPTTDILVIAILVIITGALHLDGVADTVDGLAGGRDRAKILAIMKDSRIGSFAVVGLILVLMLKVFALIEIPSDVKNRAIVVMPVMGRWSTVQLAAFFPYARSGAGTARAFVRYAGPSESLIATFVAFLIVIGAFLVKGAIILVIISAFTFFFGLCFKKRIGGVTGDIMGAACELSEVMTLLIICSLCV